ncbi:hypothetical protein CSOJ01_02884 [Colletotrichum sojae]|uniref:Uncharacterized protein n=1 Tax=Colletotrichum sojae TaxID=2175907 RepID=A0A8H6JP76_9PEZI|nr:hypothetical protein CSOJ01_02884 [Colletotrichum sojae]
MTLPAPHLSIPSIIQPQAQAQPTAPYRTSSTPVRLSAWAVYRNPLPRPSRPAQPSRGWTVAVSLLSRKLNSSARYRLPLLGFLSFPAVPTEQNRANMPSHRRHRPMALWSTYEREPRLRPALLTSSPFALGTDSGAGIGATQTLSTREHGREYGYR